MCFFLALPEKAYRGEGIQEQCEKHCKSSKKRRKEMRVLYPKVDFLPHYDSWKDADLLGVSVDM